MKIDLRNPWFRWLLFSILLLGATGGFAAAFGARDEINEVLEWTRDQGALAPVLFVLLVALVVLLFIPGVVVTTGAGFFFGVLQGTAYVVVGTTLGAAVAFLIARYFFGERARQFLMARSHVRAVTDEVGRSGWKVVMLTHLIPFFPAKASNYAFGLTPVSFRGFLVGNLLGLIPFSLHNAYIGALAAEIADGPEDGPDTWVEWAAFGLGFVATVGAVIYFGMLARRALARMTKAGKDAEAPCRG